MMTPRDEILRMIRDCHIENNVVSDSTPVVDHDDVDDGTYESYDEEWDDDE